MASNDETAGQGTGTPSVVGITDGGVVEVPGGLPLGDASFGHAGPNLVITWPDGTEVVVEDFFSADPAPTLMSSGGARMSGEVVGSLAGPVAPGQVAAADIAVSSEPIGTVENVAGTVSVTRADGTRVEFEAGDPVYQGDILETGADGAVGIVLADETSFAMGEDGRMVLDEMVYDPGTQEGSVNLAVVKGVFTFVSGQIAKADPDAMTIETPVATIGIRGTQVGVDVSDGENLNIVLMEEGDGFVGEVVVMNDGGIVVMNGANEFTMVGGYGMAPAPVTELSTDDLVNGFSTPLRFLPMRSGSENDYGLQSDDTADAGDDDLGDEDLGDLADFETAAGAEDPGAGGPEGLGAPGTVVGGDYGQTGGGEEGDLGLGDPGGETGGDDDGGEEQTAGKDGDGEEAGGDGGLPGGGFPGGGPEAGDEPVEGDEIVGTYRSEVLHGTEGNDDISALGGHDRVFGSDGDDVIRGGAHNDRLAGGDGDDTFVVEGTGDGYDRFDGGAGTDRVVGSDGDDVIGINRTFGGENSVEEIDGGEGHDVVRGTWSSDNLDFSETELTGVEEIDGGYGHDRITGSEGDDVIRGGAHNDRLAGGDGDDTFVMSAGDGADTILDFLVNDALVFEGEGFVDAFLTDSSNLRIEQDGDDAVISFAGVNGVSVRLSGVDADRLEGYATTEDEGGSVVVAFDGSVG